MSTKATDADVGRVPHNHHNHHDWLKCLFAEQKFEKKINLDPKNLRVAFLQRDIHILCEKYKRLMSSGKNSFIFMQIMSTKNILCVNTFWKSETEWSNRLWLTRSVLPATHGRWAPVDFYCANSPPAQCHCLHCSRQIWPAVWPVFGPQQGWLWPRDSWGPHFEGLPW